MYRVILRLVFPPFHLSFSFGRWPLGPHARDALASLIQHNFPPPDFTTTPLALFHVPDIGSQNIPHRPQGRGHDTPAVAETFDDAHQRHAWPWTSTRLDGGDNNSAVTPTSTSSINHPRRVVPEDYQDYPWRGEGERTAPRGCQTRSRSPDHLAGSRVFSPPSHGVWNASPFYTSTLERSGSYISPRTTRVLLQYIEMRPRAIPPSILCLF